MYVRIMHELSYRMATIAALGRDAALERFAEEDTSYSEQRARLAELEGWPPGPELAAALVEVATDAPDCRSQLWLMTLWARVSAWVEAQSMRALAGALAGGDAESDRLVVVEAARDMRVSEYSARSRAALVQQVADGLPLSWEALDHGTLTLGHVRSLAEVLRPCDATVSVAVEAKLVPQAIANGWTPGELRAAARRELLRTDPDGAKDRAERAAAEANVTLVPEEHDMASIVATTDAVTARAITDALDAEAARLRREGDTRSVGQLRVHALAAFVLGEQQAARPNVEVLLTMDLVTWLGLTRNPGELSGYGPITASMAQQLAADARLRRLITDPMTGSTLDLGRRCYRPSAPLRRLIEARDRCCRFPGCQRPATHCDIDHGRDYDDDGPTSRWNLHALCRKHHNLKTSKAWAVTLYPDGGETWVSAFGKAYDVPAASYPIYGPSDTGPPEAAISDETSVVPDPTADVISACRLDEELDPDPPPDLSVAEIDQILDAQLDAQIDATLDAVRWPAYTSAYQREMASLAGR
jgi:Domain of unknown function (DUF222)